MLDREHSKWSASQFARAIACPGQLAIQHLVEEGKVKPVWIDRPSGSYAAEGTVAHWLLERELQSGDCAVLEGTEREQDGFTITIDQDMVENISRVAERVNDLAAPGGVILSERRVDYSAYLGLPEGEAWGTSDVIIVKGRRLIVVDLKYGRGVEVNAEDNAQLMCYGLGSLREAELMGEFDDVTLVIDQPRRDHYDEHTYTVEELLHWAETVGKKTVRSVLTAKSTFKGLGDEEWCDTFLKPSEAACMWCPLKAVCPSLAKAVLAETGIDPADPAEFDDSTDIGDDLLAQHMDMADTVIAWAKAVKDEVHARLEKGHTVKGWKLVLGRRGNRAWSSAEEALEVLKKTKLKVDEYAPRKVISPTDAGRFSKAGEIGPRHWKQLEEVITRSDPQPVVAPESDKREAIPLDDTSEDFD